jgi:hypothetical protein
MKWNEKELGRLRMILETEQGHSTLEMAKNAHKTIKNRTLNAVMHKLRELIAEQEFKETEIEILGQVYPAEVISGYVVIKLADGTRCPVHIYIWESAYGPVPSGYHVHHRDGRSTNNCLENLALMSGPDHIAYHIKGSFPETFALFCFLQEKGLWKEYLTYRNTIINMMEDEKWKISPARTAVPT